MLRACLFGVVSISSIAAAPRIELGQDRVQVDKRAYRLYDQASKKFEKEQYWQATIDLMLIVDFYPEFSRLDEATLKLANCMYRMKMYSGADRMYRQVLRNEDSELVPEAILGLQKTRYEMEDYAQSLKFYEALRASYPDFERIDESRYYTGQAHYHLRHYGLVLSVSAQIEKKSSFYPYSLYTKGLANLKNKRVQKAMENLIEITRLSARKYNASQIIDSARLTLGYIYFELSNYRTALKYLLDISADFQDYADALLTTAWAAIKIEDHKFALTALNYIAEAYPNYHNIIETHFLRGQCYLKLGYYDFAVREYDFIVQNAPGASDYAKQIAEANEQLKEQERRLQLLNAELLETRLNKWDAELLMLEARVSGTDHEGGTPPLRTELEKRRKDQERLIKQIFEENRDFDGKLTSIAHLKKQIATIELQKKWKGYAGFGKVRALYLKQVASQ